MTRSWRRGSGKRHYEQAGLIVLNQVRLGQAPVSLRQLRLRSVGTWVLLSVIIVVAAVGLWLTVDSQFYVYDATVSGARHVSEQEIFKASGLSGLHILWARSGAIEAQILEQIPSLESVEASCRLPSNCIISVVERQPRVVWQEQGERWWIDKEGTVFRPQDVSSAPEALGDGTGRWLIRGPLPRDEEGRLDERVRVALAELWASGEELPTAFDYGPDQGLSFVDGRGWRVIVGRGSGMEKRLQLLERLTADLESRGVVPRFVDVRFLDAPYYLPASD